jgi:hypothetical protein
LTAFRCSGEKSDHDAYGVNVVAGRGYRQARRVTSRASAS